MGGGSGKEEEGGYITADNGFDLLLVVSPGTRIDNWVPKLSSPN